MFGSFMLLCILQTIEHLSECLEIIGSNIVSSLDGVTAAIKENTYMMQVIGGINLEIVTKPSTES